MTALFRTAWDQPGVRLSIGVVVCLRFVRERADLAEGLNLAAALGILALLPVMARGLPASYTAYAAVSWLALVCHEVAFSPLMSALRLTAVIFPVFVMLAAVGGQAVNRRVCIAVAIVFPPLMLLVFDQIVRFKMVL